MLIMWRSEERYELSLIVELLTTHCKSILRYVNNITKL